MNVTSTENPTVKQAVRLREHRERRTTGLFLVEGAREVRAAIAAGIEIDALLLAPGNDMEAPGARVLDVTDEVFAKVSYRQSPDGVLAIARAPSFALSVPPDGPLTVLVADRIEKPGNLGAMLRTADAVGAHVVVADPVVDVTSPNVVRASVGALFSVPLAVAPAGEVRAWLRAHAISTLVTSPAGTTSLWDLRAPERCAVVIGAEDTGVDDTWLGYADHVVAIPMSGTADSLNASTSAAVVLYEVARQAAAR